MKRPRCLTCFLIVLGVLLGIRCIDGNNQSQLVTATGTEAKRAEALAKDSSIQVSEFDLQVLDTVKCVWRATEQMAVDFFTLADEVALSDVVEAVHKNYIPVSVVGTLIKNNTEIPFLINAAGVGILEFSVGEKRTYKYYIKNAQTDSLFPKKEDHFDGLKVSVLSRAKYFKSSGDEQLDAWCETWNLSATRIKEYVELCKVGSSAYMYQRFMNLPCAFEGYMVWDQTIYHYSLEASGMTRLKNLNNPDQEISLGCFDPRGLKYVFTIDNTEQSEQ